ncbi:NifB/NifX family molybdenum-iron cluster-binding protein [Candidatus Bathyarchaeota archaeon]|nr:NifB/NifX family molybdenum-iron cluster-binding protein [Candidatus Bathyarchaeota archaeon]
MKICISADSGSLEANVDPRFGRCPYFLIVELEDMGFEAIGNPALAAAGGAGIQAAQVLKERGVEVVITGNVGPNAFQALSAAGIRVITGVYGTVREAIERYRRGELMEVGAPTVYGQYGMGRGRGMGRRRTWEA